MRIALCFGTALALALPGTARAGAPAAVRFTAGPEAVRAGGGARISFTVSAPIDVEVAILDARGKVVRHLAAGMLGKNAPRPFKKGLLAQEVLWDGNGDYGQKVTGVKARVRLGLRAGTAKALDVRPPNWKRANRAPATNKPAPDFTGKTAHNLYWEAFGSITAYTKGAYLERGSSRLFGDSDTGHIYYTPLEYKYHWERWYCRDPEKDAPSSVENLPYAAGSMAFGSDGLVYLFTWGWATWRMDRAGKPAPFPGTGKPGIRTVKRNSAEVDAAGYGDGMGPYATCLGLDGKIYSFVSHPQTGYARLHVWGRDGKLEKSGFIPFARARHVSNIRVDREGFLYVALNGLPEGWKPPQPLKPDFTRSFMGTVVKLRIESRWTGKRDPEAGKVPSSAAKKAAGVVLEGGQVSWKRPPPEWGTCTGQGRLKLLPHVKVFVADVERAIPGVSWALPSSMCSCSCLLMDMDRFGRLYLPDPARSLKLIPICMRSS